MTYGETSIAERTQHKQVYELDERRECGRMALRQKLFELGMQGKVPILIFLAKNWLGMSDRGDQPVFEGPLPWID